MEKILLWEHKREPGYHILHNEYAAGRSTRAEVRHPAEEINFSISHTFQSGSGVLYAFYKFESGSNSVRFEAPSSAGS
jgi:hypothetical protein